MVAPILAQIAAAGVRLGGLRFRITSFGAVKNYLKELPEEAFEDVKAVFEKNTEAAYKKMIARTSGNPIKRRSGALQNSIKYGVTGNSLSNVRGFLSTTSPYARIHEYGGVIKAKNKYLWLRGGPYMNIPTPQNTGSDGKPVTTSRMLFSRGGTVKSGSSGFGLYMGNSKMFHLAKSVSLKARLGFRDTGTDQLAQIMSDLEQIYLARGGKS